MTRLKESNGPTTLLDKTLDMMLIAAFGWLINEVKYCTKVIKTGAAGKKSNSSASLKPFLRNVTQCHRRWHFRQSLRDVFRTEVANGVISGVIEDRTGTHVTVKFCKSKSTGKTPYGVLS